MKISNVKRQIDASRAGAAGASRACARFELLLRAARHPFVAAMRRALREECHTSLDGSLIVGVSGGADSVALLVGLAAIAARTRGASGLRPIAVHVHHHLRGVEADRDAVFVEGLARRLDLTSERCDIHPARRRGNRESLAREERYSALADMARRHGSTIVATAHHADDQLETMLMALCRGCGLDGLAGMSSRRALGPGVELIRPLLGSSKKECEAFLRTIRLRWRTDSSNADRTRTRNRLRAEVLPVLESLWPGAATRAAKTARMVQGVAARG